MGVVSLFVYTIAFITQLRQKVRCTLPYQSITAVRGIDREPLGNRADLCRPTMPIFPSGRGVAMPIDSAMFIGCSAFISIIVTGGCVVIRLATVCVPRCSVSDNRCVLLRFWEAVADDHLTVQLGDAARKGVTGGSADIASVGGAIFRLQTAVNSIVAWRFENDRPQHNSFRESGIQRVGNRCSAGQLSHSQSRIELNIRAPVQPRTTPISFVAARCASCHPLVTKHPNA